MRRALLAILLCAASATVAAPQALGDVVDQAALRDLARLDARAAGNAGLPLPLSGARDVSTASAGELAAIARTDGPVRVLVGARSHAAVPSLARALARLGARPEVFRLSGVLAATAPSGSVLARSLGADPRVAYIERDRELSVAADPFDSVDTTPGGSGIKFTWAYDEVGAAPALAAAGGGSRRIVAVVDTGVDIRHPELAGRIARTYDVHSHRADVTDRAGHGTFVAGLIAAVDGNGIGGKGVAGNTRLLVIRASRTGSLTVRALARSIEAAVARGADVMNLSLAGPGFSLSQARALATAFYNDVLPVAASGNNGQSGNPLEFPAAAVGGTRGRRGVGLSVSATTPGGGRTEFATHNDYVSIAAPGAGASGCELGVFSILPSGGADEWDDPLSCSPAVLTGRRALRLRRGHQLRGPARLRAGRSRLAGAAATRLGAGGPCAHAHRAPDGRHQVLERVHRRRRGGRWRGHGPGPRV